MKFSYDKIFFYICIAIVLLIATGSYGYLVHKNHIFPYHFISDAVLAAKAIVEVHTVWDSDIKGIDFFESELSKPTANTFSNKVGNENIFILSNEFAHRNVSETGFFAWIIDRSGKVLHAWKNIPEIWKPLENREALGDNWRSYPVGAYLYPNGDVLVSYQGGNVFPNGMGLAKFDKNSNILWKKNGYYHHWFDVDDMGRIYVPSQKVVESPLKIPDHEKFFECNKKKFYYDTLAILNPDGTVIEEIDIFHAIINSGLAGVFHNNGHHHEKIESCDPLHLNDIRLITKEDAANSNKLNGGDLLLSFRSLNAVGIFDLNTRLFKWFHIGAFHYQHSPRYIGNNRIFAFDNLGGQKSRGTSRIVSINLQNSDWGMVFPKEGVKIPSRPFFSKTAGHIDIHPDEKRMIVSWTHQGLVWEIDIESGGVLWEYVNTHPVDDQKFGRLSVYTSMYVKNATFDMNGGFVNQN